MIDNSAIYFLGILIFGMSLIQILLMIVKDIKMWNKLDRIVLFFGSERDLLRRSIDNIKESIEYLNREIVKLKSKIDTIGNDKNTK